MEGEALCHGEVGLDVEVLKPTGGPCVGHLTGFVAVHMENLCVSKEFMAVPLVHYLCILTVTEGHRSFLPLWPVEECSWKKTTTESD